MQIDLSCMEKPLIRQQGLRRDDKDQFDRLEKRRKNPKPLDKIVYLCTLYETGMQHLVRSHTMSCRHCGHSPASRPRGLCWTCYYTPQVRDQYTSTSKYGRRGVEDSYGRFHLPPVPTQALPGTAEKVAVLIARALQRQALWH